MGVGHVPPGSLPAQSEGDELPRCEHRGTRAVAALVVDRARLARFGEAIAARFLVERGLTVLARNRRVGRGEIDLVAATGTGRVAVEVKTRAAGSVDPRQSFTPAKARQVHRLAAALRISRVDLVTVSVGRAFVDVRWLPEMPSPSAAVPWSP